LCRLSFNALADVAV